MSKDKDTKYKQVELVRTEELGSALISTVTHIPSNLAEKGRFVELKEDSKWQTWQVSKVSETELSSEQAKKLAKKYHKGWHNNI